MARKNYPGTIETRRHSRRVILYAAGKRHAFTLPGASEKEAREFARRKHRELGARVDREALGFPTSIRVSALLEKYEAEYLPTLSPNTRVSYPKSIAAIRTFFVEGLGDPHIQTIRAKHVADFLGWRRVHRPHGQRREQPVSNRTLQKDRAILHRIFRIAENLELRDGNPVSRVESPKIKERDPVLLTEDQYEALLDGCGENDMLRLWVLLCGETGCRSQSEALWLRWEDIDLEASFLWIDSTRHGRRTKSGKGRWVPMTDRLGPALREHMARHRLRTYKGHRSPWVFHHPISRGKGTAGDRMRSMRDAFERVRDDLDLPEGFVAHDLRHRRATIWIAEGGSVVLVKEALGHSAIQTTMRYTHLAREHLRSLVASDAPIHQARGAGL